MIDGDEAKKKFAESLQAVPIVSISMSDSDMFDSKSGLYCKPVLLDGQEKVADIEWVTGSQVFGVCAGLKMQGHASRRFENTPKKSFRMCFRSKYGDGKLPYPVLKDCGFSGEDFNTLILRAEHNEAWTSKNATSRSRASYIIDQVTRDLQGEMSGYQSHGVHVQLFINGLYWGVYNLCERSDDAFAASNWGGEKEDWDVVKNDDTGTGALYTMRDGDSEYFQTLCKMLDNRDLSTQQGYEDVSASLNPTLFADYILIEYFVCNKDWPLNNWIASGSSSLKQPFRFTVWDSEIAWNEATDSRIAYKTGTYSPQKFQRQLEQSAEYKLLFADRAHRHLFNKGALTVEMLTNRLIAAAAKARPALFSESARWGAYRHDISADVPVMGLDDFDAEIKRLTTDYVPKRVPKFIAQLRTAGLYPTINAPEFVKSEDSKCATVTMDEGVTTYYTTDGSDPRVAYTGTVNASARLCEAGGILSLPEGGTVYARSLSGSGEWSALSEVELVADVPAVVKNVFLPSKNGVNWDEDANWSEGVYPNGTGVWAVIEAPTAVKKDKGWRNIHINKNNIIVGHVEVTSGGWTNRIDTGKSGDLTFSAGEGTNATFVVMDRDDASLAMIDLDEPNTVFLDSDTEFVVSNETGDVNWGGLWLKGVFGGPGRMIKLGPGLMTCSFTNSPSTVSLGRIQIREGAVAITVPIRADSITGDGACSALLGGTDLDAAVARAIQLDDKLSADAVNLFVPSYVGGVTYYGGFVAVNDLSGKKKCKVYVKDATGSVVFNCERYVPVAGATVAKIQLPDGRYTYSVTVPDLNMSVVVDREGNETLIDESVPVEQIVASLRSGGMVVLKGVQKLSVDNVNHTVIVDGETYGIAEYYDARVEQNHLYLDLNEAARPVLSETEKGADDAFVVSDEVVSVGGKTQVGLTYTLQAKDEMDADWIDVETVKGTGESVKFMAMKFAKSGFYRIRAID